MEKLEELIKEITYEVSGEDDFFKLEELNKRRVIREVRKRLDCEAKADNDRIGKFESLSEIIEYIHGICTNEN